MKFFNLQSIIFIYLMFNMSSVNASSLEIAKSLLPNVVKIKSIFDNHVESGFGFIIGQDDKNYYFVTANHVVRGRKPKDIATDIFVSFFEITSSSQKATLLGKSNTEDDIALFSIKKEKSVRDRLPVKLFRWDSEGLTHKLQESKDVVFIGKKSQWYIPNEVGEISKINETSLIVENLNAEKGSSGAPLISDSGIIGLLIDDNLNRTKATLIKQIHTLAKKQGIPWGLKTWKKERNISGLWHYQEKWLEDNAFGENIEIDIKMTDLVRFNFQTENKEMIGKGIVEGNELKAWWYVDEVWESAHFTSDDEDKEFLKLLNKKVYSGIAHDNEDDENYKVKLTYIGK